MKKRLVVFVLCLVIAFFMYGCTSQKSTYIELDEEKIECHDNALYFIFTEANIIADELNVQKVRCSQGTTYEQWEMTGTYFENNDHSKEPKPFYFQEIRGGMAASGADGYDEVCLIINNETIISKIETGRDMNYQSPARCSWQSQLS